MTVVVDVAYQNKVTQHSQRKACEYILPHAAAGYILCQTICIGGLRKLCDCSVSFSKGIILQKWYTITKHVVSKKTVIFCNRCPEEGSSYTPETSLFYYCYFFTLIAQARITFVYGICIGYASGLQRITKYKN